MIIFDLLVLAAQIAFLYAAIYVFLFLFACVIIAFGQSMINVLIFGSDEWDWLVDGVTDTVVGATTTVQQAATVVGNEVRIAYLRTALAVNSWLPFGLRLA